jgi:hypothetical protein
MMGKQHHERGDTILSIPVRYGKLGTVALIVGWFASVTIAIVSSECRNVQARAIASRRDEGAAAWC